MSNPDGTVRFSITVTAGEMATWSPERISTFFDGVAAILRACDAAPIESPPPRSSPQDTVDEATERAQALYDTWPLLRETVDEVYRFLADRCVIEDGPAVGSRELYDAYAAWSVPSSAALSLRRFGLGLTALGFKRKKVGLERRWHWLGLRLL